MTEVTRRRLLAGAAVAAFVAVFAGVGALSKSDPALAAAPLPSVSWYWTMAVSPSDTDVVVVGTSNGLYRSSDGGKMWQPTGPKGVEATSVVQAGSSIFAGGVPVAPTASPVIRKGTARAAPDGTAVLAESTDGGKTWQTLRPRGLPDVTVQALAVDPAKTTALYALLNTGRLYRSTDGARSFQLVSSKLGVTPWALAITQNGHFVAGDMDGGSHLSPNGKAWQRTAFTDSRGGRMVMEYAVAPTDSTRVLMSAYGLEISTDSGKTWHVALKSKVMFGPVAWAAGTSGVAYAIGFDASVWRSGDGGKSWAKVT
jgi:photosystem II stability/assembly factor-like uncharacterized protein